MMTARPVLAATLVALSLTGLSAQSHSSKEGTVPADGASLATAPATVSVTFDSPTLVTRFKITDDTGTEHGTEGGGLTPTLEYSVVPAALAPGRYMVEWRGLSSDGHPVEGMFSFSVE